MIREYEVFEFDYNGFYGQCNESVIMPYTATFQEWTADPGIGKFICSDAEVRLIPTFALKEFSIKELPVQEKTGMMFGVACQS